MATRRTDTRTAHERLDEAGRYIAKLEKRIKALEGQLEEASEQIAGFTKLVREQSSSLQKAAHANYRAIDRRISKLEYPPNDEAAAEAADAMADLPANER